MREREKSGWVPRQEVGRSVVKARNLSSLHWYWYWYGKSPRFPASFRYIFPPQGDLYGLVNTLQIRTHRIQPALSTRMRGDCSLPFPHKQQRAEAVRARLVRARVREPHE